MFIDEIFGVKCDHLVALFEVVGSYTGGLLLDNSEGVELLHLGVPASLTDGIIVTDLFYFLVGALSWWWLVPLNPYSRSVYS